MRDEDMYICSPILTPTGMENRSGAALAFALLIAGLACGGSSRDSSSETAHSPSVVTSDVHNFVAGFSKWTPADTTCRSLDGYLKAGSAGLRTYRDKMGMGPTDLCRAVRRDPKRYAALQTKLPAIDSAQRAIDDAFAKFVALSPGATLPSVYFVVGDEMSGGTTTSGSAPIVLVGAELLGSLDGLPVLTVHELVHTQQHYPTLKIIAGGPQFIHGTVLAQSIKEGSANFLAELATGHAAAASLNAYGDTHEREIWRDFKRDMHSRDYSQWIYDGWNRKALGDRPIDLGYYVGYRITKAYYDKLTDKRKAIRDILSIRDFDDFLLQSGYSGDAAPRQ